MDILKHLDGQLIKNELCNIVRFKFVLTLINGIHLHHMQMTEYLLDLKQYMNVVLNGRVMTIENTTKRIIAMKNMSKVCKNIYGE